VGKKGFVLCVCQGTCPSFTKMAIFGVLSDIRRVKLFDYVCLHPQLCVSDDTVANREMVHTFQGRRS